jgi:biotin operon repressor
MQKRTTTLGVALAGAVVLAGGAYALGAQKDDGNALANNGARMGYGWGYGPGPGGGPPGGPGRAGGRFMEERLAEAAKKLGVTEAQLRTALQDLRPDRGQKDDKKDELTAELAAALGIPEAKVKAALDKVRPGKRFRTGPGGGPGGAPGGPPPGGYGGPPPRRTRGKATAPLAGLATELGVTEAQLRTAMETIRQKKQDEFAQKLADKLGIPVEKVKSAFPGKPGP